MKTKRCEFEDPLLRLSLLICEKLGILLTQSLSFILYLLFINMNTVLQALLLAMLLALASSANVCSSADELECTSTLCPNFFWYNNTCKPTTFGTQCSTGQMPASWNTTTPSSQAVQGGCLTCIYMSELNCTTACPGYIWGSQNGSVAATCISCETLFGPNCVRCTTSICLSCAFSSGSTLTPTSTGCVAETCSVTNCVDCYDSGRKCSVCQVGYMVNPTTFICETASCVIVQCAVCEVGKCARCNLGYTPSPDGSSCQPVCSDIFCSICVGPNICGTCISPYSPDNAGKCQINCALISVSNCAQCSTAYSCTVCATGYTLVQNGALCQGTCQISNCQYCIGNINSCTSCSTGYDLVFNQTSNSLTCVQGVCEIQYCKTCLNVSACSACIDFFTLSTDQKSCTSKCSTSYNLTNCLFCNSTYCYQCQENYVMNSSTCVLPCASIAQCTTCYSSTLCKTCAEGYALTPDSKTCKMTCQVDGCDTCTSPTASSCSTCKAGYSTYTDGSNNTLCAINCGEGEVNTGSGTVSCTKCSSTISYCQTCTYSSASSMVVAQSCQEGYFVSGNTCVKCITAIPQCFKCSNANTCEDCNPGFNLIGGACANPRACPGSQTNCKTCNTQGSCDICNPGYVPSSGTSVVSCIRKACHATYTLDTNDNCVCPSATYESQGSCKPCPDERCNNCTINSCLKCAKGFYALGTTCRACIPNCEACSTGTTCDTCSSDYSKTNNGQSCVMLGSGGGITGVVGRGGQVIQCPWGCRVCITGAMTTYQTICTIPRPGYSIVGGRIVRCQSPCRTCKSYDRTRCTSCYYRYANVQGTCTRCTDVNALTCSNFDPSYSYRCRSGYISGYFPASNTYPGQCLACASYCRSCRTAGPGNCDRWGCYYGTVQLSGTQNCTKCFRGCSRCSTNDPTECTSCRYRLFLDSATKSCLPCNPVCRYCRNSADFCYSCIRGYQVVSNTCMKVPANCVRLDSSGNCSGCFKGYILNGTFCSPDVSCNGNSSCQICPYGYYQSGVTCLACPLPSNCIACDAANTTACTMCNVGYYLRSQNNACYRCAYNCLECDDYDECTVAKDGYYVPENQNGETIGWARSCKSPCATCSGASDFCKSCKSGYTLNGAQCRQNFYLMMTLVLSYGRTASIILSTQSQAEQLFSVLRSLNRLGAAIDATMPISFNDGRNWMERLRFIGISIGSVIPQLSMDTGNFVGSNSAAASAVTTALSTSNIDGLTYLSSSIEAVGGSSTEDSGPNLALILGIVIPSVVLIAIITVLVVRKVCLSKVNQENAVQNDGELFEKDEEHPQEKHEKDFNRPFQTNEPHSKHEFSYDAKNPSVDQLHPKTTNFEATPDYVYTGPVQANVHELDIEGSSDAGSVEPDAVYAKPVAPAQYELDIEGSQNENVDNVEEVKPEQTSPLKDLRGLRKKSTSGSGYLKVEMSPVTPEKKVEENVDFGVTDY